MANNLLNFPRVAIVAAMTLLAVPAHAGSYLDDMATLEAQIALVNKRAELQAVLKNGRSTEVLPTILSIIVDRKGATAQLAYASGLKRWVTQGGFIADGLKVGKITEGSVMAVGRGVATPLSFYAEGESPTDQASPISLQAPSISIPPLPYNNRSPATEVPVAKTPGA